MEWLDTGRTGSKFMGGGLSDKMLKTEEQYLEDEVTDVLDSLTERLFRSLHSYNTSEELG